MRWSARLFALVLAVGCPHRIDLPEVAADPVGAVGVPGAPAQARAAYLQALWHEARGEREAAVEALSRARAFDPQSDALARAEARLRSGGDAPPPR